MAYYYIFGLLYLALVTAREFKPDAGFVLNGCIVQPRPDNTLNATFIKAIHEPQDGKPLSPDTITISDTSSAVFAFDIPKTYFQACALQVIFPPGPDPQCAPYFFPEDVAQGADIAFGENCRDSGSNYRGMFDMLVLDGNSKAINEKLTWKEMKKLKWKKAAYQGEPGVGQITRYTDDKRNYNVATIRWTGPCQHGKKMVFRMDSFGNGLMQFPQNGNWSACQSPLRPIGVYMVPCYKAYDAY